MSSVVAARGREGVELPESWRLGGLQDVSHSSLPQPAAMYWPYLHDGTARSSSSGCVAQCSALVCDALLGSILRRE